ncbi:hypothetical protein D9619_007423 [Psilocybe cf. subviscida]|uniref:Protein kinase domain-containing protein n=1 Tax=Psilocybe cf. subviscida TaxID=2480587 RepID=A0A8H5B293_9AGAR|nr:hypothetical protein D9619_007423 [Psilocybe cf. subviscida]
MGILQSRPPGYYSEKYLSSGELQWLKLQPFLLQRGYQLRPRFQPDWTPSWKRWGNFGRRSELSSEDALKVTGHEDLIDAIRLSDGKKVVIKIVRTERLELRLLLLLNGPNLRQHPDNKTVEVLDVLLRPDTDETALVVMPKLMNFALIPFQFVEEVTDAFSQLLAGLSFYHLCDIAHMDACFSNLMLDSTGIAPKGFHFARNILSEKGDFDEPMPYLTRRAVAPVKYYFIDVGISRFFMPHCEDRSFYGSWGQDRTVPEFENEDKPHDPFKVDVYQLGSVFKRITTNYEGLEFLQPLVERMTSHDPSSRPTAQEASRLLADFVSSLSEDDLSRRIWYKAATIDLRHRIASNNESPSELLWSTTARPTPFCTMSSRHPSSAPAQFSVAPDTSGYTDSDVPTTLKAVRLLIEKTMLDVYNLPEGAPNRATVLEDAIRLKESLDKAESKMIKLWGVIKLRENRKDITELEASRDALEGSVFASTTEFMRLQAEVTEETNDQVVDIRDTHRRTHSFDRYIDDFNESLDLRMAISRRNINNPGPGPGQIQSPLIGNLYLDITNELAAERNAAARQAKLDQQKRDRERQEEERNRREWEERALQASRITVQPITLEDLDLPLNK